MIESTDRQRERVGWSISILLHAGLLILAAVWLVHPARFSVQAGKTSMEIDLIVETAPVPATTVSPPKPSAKPILPQPAPLIPTPAPMKTAVTVRHEPRNPPVPSKSSPARETSRASKGALQAQPDELNNEPPDYPEESRIAREQGVVILRVEVTAAGEPASVSILQSSGYFRLDQAARKAVLHWKFHPAMSAGIAVASEADVPVHFKLQ
ncbi:MAG: TonB family protein [Methylacidiphilales bacterium]|nr:TonB family protein [Candidatus Methylacidiphilales bacterium]